MDAKTRKRLERQRDRRACAEGGGVWFHKETREQVFVSVQFYPSVALELIASTNVRRITKEELEAEYERLRL